MMNISPSRHAPSDLLKAWPTAFQRQQKSPGWHVLANIEDGQPARFVCPADVVVTCVSGTAWITTGADTRDVVLKAGQRHIAARRDRLFINAIPCCLLRFEPMAPTRLIRAHR